MWYYGNQCDIKDPKSSNNNSSSLTKEDYIESGKSKFDREDYNGAISDFTKAISLNPDYAAAYQNRGIVKKKVKKDLL